MRTIFTNDDAFNIIKNCYNAHTEPIVAINESGEEEETDMVSYLNIDFYTWKQRLQRDDNGLTSVESWLQSLNYSLKKSICLVEVSDSEIVKSQDIDSSTISGSCTYLIQTDKVQLLDYYVNKLRNIYVGSPQEIQNSQGDLLTAYVNIGILVYSDEPMQTPLGEVVKVTSNFQITYISKAYSYSDYKVELSLDGLTYTQLPFSKLSWASTYEGNTLTVQANPTRVGKMNSSMGTTLTISFFDFQDTFANALTQRALENACTYSIESGTIVTPTTNVNVQVKVRITYNSIVYHLDMVLCSYQKDITNGDICTCSIQLTNSALGGE